MSKKLEVGLMLATLIVSGVVGGYSYVSNKKSPSPKLLALQADSILDSRDSIRNKYTLVEFLDYECPPCKSKYIYIKSLISKDSRLTLSIRNLPLPFHKNARHFAINAEKSRYKNEFNSVFHYLMSQSDLSKESADVFFKSKGIEVTNDDNIKKLIINDEKLARKIGISGTPSFVLCTPDNKAYLLVNLSQIAGLIK